MWEISPLIKAAIYGRIAVLDNIDRLPMGALSVLQGLIHERQVFLHDGTRLVSSETHSQYQAEYGLSAEQLQVLPSWRLTPKKIY